MSKRLARTIPSTATMELLPFPKGFHKGLDLLDESTWIEITSTTAPSLNGNHSTLERTKEAMERGFQNVIPHIAARAIQNSYDFDRTFNELQALGVKHLFVVGGDAAWTDVDSAAPNAYNNGLELIQALTESSYIFESIGIPGYPAGHYNPEVDKRLQSDLLKKLQALSECEVEAYIQTAFDFDPETVSNWIEEQRGINVKVPIKVGLFGPVGVKAAIRSMELNGGPRAAAAFMKRTGLNPANIALGKHAEQSAQVAQHTAEKMSSNTSLHITGYTINTIGDVGAALENKRFAPVYDAAAALDTKN